MFYGFAQNNVSQISLDNSPIGPLYKNGSSGNSGNNNIIKVFIKDLLRFFVNSARVGSSQKQAGISLERFFEGIVISFLYMILQMLIFIFLRNLFKNIYQANQCLHPERYPNNWVFTIINYDLSSLKAKCGLDAYFQLRYLRLLSTFFLSLTFLNVPVLLPIHFQSGKNINSLDRFNMSNINSNIMIAHLIICFIDVVWFHFILIREFKIVKTLVAKELANGKYQNILLIEGCPLNKLELTNNFTLFGRIQKISFVCKNHKDISTVWKKTYLLERDLEMISYQIFLEEFYRQPFRQYLNSNNSRLVALENTTKYSINKLIFYFKTWDIRLKCGIILNQCKYANEFTKIPVPNSNSFLNNRFETLKDKIAEYQDMISKIRIKCEILEKKQQSTLLSPEYFHDKAFIQFDSPLTANLFGQLFQTNNKGVSIMIGPNPNDIIWRNIICQFPCIKFIRVIAARILAVFTIIGWIIPVALIGLISRIPYFNYIFWVPSNVNNDDSIINNLLVTIFPVVSLIFLTEYVPYVFRVFSYMKGCKTGAEIEIDIQKWFFVFLFVHLFIVVTISSGVSLIIEIIVNDPISVPSLLAEELPKSSNFFCSFIIIRGMAYAGGNFLRVKELLLEIFYYRIKLTTPHLHFQRIQNSLVFQWGSIYPLFSVLSCIVIIYSVISPLILPLACVAFMLVYFSFKYLLEYQYIKENTSETFGQLYPQALIQLYVGIYFLETCLLGLFALSNKYDLSVCMIIFIIITMFGHHKVSKLYLTRDQAINYSDYNKETLPQFKYTHNSQITRNFWIPNVNLEKNLGKIWIPYDISTDGNDKIAISHQEYMEVNFGLFHDIDKCFIDNCGDMYLHV